MICEFVRRWSVFECVQKDLQIVTQNDFAAITTLLLLFLSPCLPPFAARGWMIVHSPVGWGCDEALGREPGRRDRRGGLCPAIGHDECHRACLFVIGCQRQVYRYGQVRLPATYSWWTPNAKCRWRGIKTNSENTFHCAAKVHSMVISQLGKRIPLLIHHLDCIFT